MSNNSKNLRLNLKTARSLRLFSVHSLQETSKTTGSSSSTVILPDGEKEVGSNQLIPLCLPLAHLPGLLVCPTRQEMLEDVTVSQHRVADHVVHPPDQTLPPLRDEVLLKAARGLLLWQVGHRDDGETLDEPSVEPVEMFIPAGMKAGDTGLRIGLEEEGLLKWKRER